MRKSAHHRRTTCTNVRVCVGCGGYFVYVYTRYYFIRSTYARTLWCPRNVYTLHIRATTCIKAQSAYSFPPVYFPKQTTMPKRERHHASMARTPESFFAHSSFASASTLCRPTVPCLSTPRLDSSCCCVFVYNMLWPQASTTSRNTRRAQDIIDPCTIGYLNPQQASTAVPEPWQRLDASVSFSTTVVASSICVPFGVHTII